MPLIHGYITRDRLKEAVGSRIDTHDNDFDRAIGAASRKIDKWTGRYFYQDTVASPRLFKADDRTYVCVSDFADPASMVIETDDDGDGVFETTWTADQWQPEPFVLYNGEPFTIISTTTRTREFPFGTRRPLVRATTRWGWLPASLPPQVEQATEYAATLFYRGKDQYGAAIGLIDQTEKMTADPLKLAMELVREFAVKGGTLYKPCGC